MKAELTVEEVCLELFEARAKRALGESRVQRLSRDLAAAVAEQVQTSESYHPEIDRRVLWAHKVLSSAMEGQGGCIAEADLEALARMLLGLTEERVLSGKDYAAGAGRRVV